MTQEIAIEKLKKDFPDAEIELVDYRNDGMHFNLTITSSKFKGLNLIDQHKLVYAALNELIDSGDMHALKIKTIAK